MNTSISWFEFYGKNPRPKGEIIADIDHDGSADYFIHIGLAGERHDPIMLLLELPREPTSKAIAEDEAAFGMVLEARLPLEFFVSEEKPHITKIHSVRRIEEEETLSDILKSRSKI